jgi:hypothetical protein
VTGDMALSPSPRRLWSAHARPFKFQFMQRIAPAHCSAPYWEVVAASC